MFLNSKFDSPKIAKIAVDSLYSKPANVAVPHIHISDHNFQILVTTDRQEFYNLSKITKSLQTISLYTDAAAAVYHESYTTQLQDDSVFQTIIPYILIITQLLTWLVL